MAKLEEMNAEIIEAVVEDVDDDDDDTMLTDLVDGITLVRQSKVLLSFLADPDLCKSLTKRERDSMDRLCDKMDSYLDDMEEGYEE